MRRAIYGATLAVVALWVLSSCWWWPDLTRPIKCAVIDPCAVDCPPTPKCGD